MFSQPLQLLLTTHFLCDKPSMERLEFSSLSLVSPGFPP